ncbi:uncharacterized protein I303_105813 [Kwoniella dejecticola CBS 10117]|uniref:HMG box domain-containing protein n=1 Tax=Kwoniella dejecticola CBS 10117 TaxID=1296121 RepID=A0A1A6A0G6_9TREE|nr:uncharacterized protein I303_05835 [Kwoniella dejecticola CBS 10117]OBR83555.1 hypothetical protein I303_05835 [Kwoniella dejecticola CBS 10117]
MSAPTYEEMEAKRQEMIASFREIAGAMTRCVKIIEEYTALSPPTLKKPDLSIFQNAMLSNGQPISEFLSKNQLLLQPVKERKKKDKKPRDPNAPKRPPSAYIFFQNEIRDEIRNSNPGMSYKDILGVISLKWKDLTDAQRKVYEDAYAKAQIDFVENEKAYTATKPPGTGPDGTRATTTAGIDPTLMAGQEDDSDDSDDSDTDDSPEPPKLAAPALPTTLPLQVNPSTLHAAAAAAARPGIPDFSQPIVSSTPAEKKKDKKRKPKEVTTPAEAEKKKKKSKE